ncbi:hypothetical protein ACFE04_000365 [Oxalis oulophora]
MARPFEDDEDDFNDEAERLTKEIKVTIKDVEESEFYADLCNDIRTSKKFKRYLDHTLGGSHSHVQVVVYALGNIEFSFRSQSQLALIIALTRDFPTWILPEIEVYDPCFSPADKIALKNLGCNVLSIDEHCSRRVERPTLFFMPVANYHSMGDILAANWLPFRINQMIILTNAMANPCMELRVKMFQEFDKYNIDPYLLYLHKKKSEKDDRGPRKFRCKPGPHPKGWIKINFSGRKISERLARFGYVIYNDKKEIVEKMSGRLEEGDEFEANLEALKQALKSLLLHVCLTSSTVKNLLIINGDNLSVIRWINNNGKAPKKMRKSLEEILLLMKNFHCFVYHIYEEANLSAMETVFNIEPTPCPCPSPTIGFNKRNMCSICGSTFCCHISHLLSSFD